MSEEEKAEKRKMLQDAIEAKERATRDEYAERVSDEIKFWQAGWKDRYYADKYKVADIAKGGGRDQVFREYVTGLCWVMKYYYEGCASWKWYYPFHYAPFASDLRNIEEYHMEFEASEPFRPFEQLMAVLPKESVAAIPPACRDLMLSPESPIADFYPDDVEVDPNGKAMPWLWVVLLPFIDEERLLLNLVPTYAKFDEEETDRNTFRTATMFAHKDSGAIGECLTQALASAAAAEEEGLVDEEEGSKVSLSCEVCGIGGAVMVPSLKANGRAYSCHIRKPSQAVIAPAEPKGKYEDIVDNQMVAVQYENPPRMPRASF